MNDDNQALDDEITGEWPRPPKLAVPPSDPAHEDTLEFADTLPMHGGAIDRLIRQAKPAESPEPQEPA